MAKQLKLLNKSFRYFLVLAIVLLAGSIPFYYYSVESIWLEELDERNLVIAQKLENTIFKHSHSLTETQEKIGWLNATNPDVKIVPFNDPEIVRMHDFTTYLPDRIDTLEMDRFRIHKTYVTFKNIRFEITVFSNIEEESEILGGIVSVTIIFFLLLVAGFLVLNTFLTKKLWRPFYTTLAEIDRFKISEDPITLPETAIHEFTRLNAELNRLMLSAVQAYRQQKEFLENASHELQTPIAVLRSKLEMLRQKVLSDEQAIAISELEKPLQRLSILNKNLLLLAKIENDQFGKNDLINVEEVLRHSLDLLEIYITEKRLKVNITSQSVLVKGNEVLCYTLVSNLLSNACKFTHPDSTIEIELTENKLLVRNPGVQPLENERMGKRFAKGTNGETGLGLAIAFEVCVSQNWELKYQFLNRKHIFSVSFFRNSGNIQNRV